VKKDYHVNDLSPQARRTLAQAKAGQPRASQALRARVRANVQRAIAAAPATLLAEDLPLKAANSAALANSSASKLPVWALPSLGAIAIMGAIAGYAAQRPVAHVAPVVQPKAAERVAVEPQAAPVETSPVDALLQPPSDADNVAVNTRRPRRSITPRASTRAQDAELRAEMQLLARAEAALRNNEPQSALSILDTHARQHSSGQLQSERAGLRLIAQCALGRDPQSALDRYLREHRDGVLQGRIRASCARFLP
jgi:hypothetical protein